MNDKKENYMKLFDGEDEDTLKYASEYYKNNYSAEADEVDEYGEYYDKTEYIEDEIQKKIDNYIEYNVKAPLRYADKYLLMA